MLRALKIIFAVVGSLAALLAIASLVLAFVFYTPDASGRAVLGSALYLGIAIVCFYAFFRMKRMTDLDRQRGFDAVMPKSGNPSGR